MRLYRFEDRYLDLASLQWLEMDGIPSSEFKSHSLFANRFRQPGFKNGWPEIQTFLGTTFEIEGNDGSILPTLSTGQVVNTPDACVRQRRETTEDHYLLVAEKGVAEIARCGNDEIVVRLFKEQGEIFLHTVLGRLPGEEENTLHPYHNLFFCDFSLRNLIYTSRWGDDHETIVVNLSDGTQSHFDFEVAGVVFAENELDVQGFLVQDKQRSSLLYKSVNGNSVALTPQENDNSFTALVSGDTLFVAGYHNIATGSSLSAFDLRSGKLLWKADVTQMGVAHSEYYNEVILSKYNHRLMLEGHEAGGKYLQVFDALTGKKLL